MSEAFEEYNSLEGHARMKKWISGAWTDTAITWHALDLFIRAAEKPAERGTFRDAMFEAIHSTCIKFLPADWKEQILAAYPKFSGWESRKRLLKWYYGVIEDDVITQHAIDICRGRFKPQNF